MSIRRKRRAAASVRHSALLAGLVLGFVAPRSGAQRAAAGQHAKIAVVSVIGDVRAGRDVVIAGVALGRSADFAVGRGAVVQLLVDEAIAVALWGAGWASVDARGRPPTIALRGETRARLSGGGRAITAAGWTVTLHAPGSAIIAGQRVFVLRGRAAIAAPAGSRCLAASQPADATGALHMARAGEAAVLDETACGAAQPGAAPADELARSFAHAPPSAWQPARPQTQWMVAAGRAVQVMRAEQRTAQETASCGCTEGGGGTAGPVGQSAAGQALERRNATLRVRVTGVPKGGAR